MSGVAMMGGYDNWQYMGIMDITAQPISFESAMEASPEDRTFIDLSGFSPLNPEEVLLKKDSWQSLGQEAKELINLVIDCPVEIVAEIIGTRRRSRTRNPLTQARIINFLSRTWDDPIVAGETVEEIKQFLREGGSLEYSDLNPKRDS